MKRKVIKGIKIFFISFLIYSFCCGGASLLKNYCIKDSQYIGEKKNFTTTIKEDTTLTVSEKNIIITERKIKSTTKKEFVPPIERDRKIAKQRATEMETEKIMLAKVAYHEAGTYMSDEENAAVIWCILNRVDSESFADDIPTVITQPNQFVYIVDTPINKRLYELAQDVLSRWHLEKMGYGDVGRVLPKDYKFFEGDSHTNRFRKEFTSTEIWDWSLESPY